MNALVVLGAILFILMVVVGRGSGVRAFVALFFNFAVVLIAVIFMADPNANPIILTMIACVVISCINIFFTNGVSRTTQLAFLSTMLTIGILFVIIIFATKNANIQGFSEEEADDIAVYSLYLSVDFIKIAAAVIIMSTIGAIIDIAISITSPMRELVINNPKIERSTLFKAGLSIGRDVLGTTTNTLYFAFVGGYLSLIIWFKDLSYSLGEIVNSKVFSAEVISILCAGVGVALSIPISAVVTAYFLIRER